MKTAHVLPIACSTFLLASASVAIAQAPLYDISGMTSDELGHSVAWVGDLNGDGFDDFAVGAPFGDGLQPDAGYVQVRSAKDASTLLHLKGERTGDRYGWSVAGLGDINGDGIGDLIVGAPTHEWTSGTDRGAVYMISGANGQQIWKLGGNFDSDWLGWCVAGAGDVNGDGVPDYAMGQPGFELGGSDYGRVLIHSGANHTSLRSYYGETAGDRFGTSVAFAGDVTGDGVPDLVAGAPYYDTGFALPAGRAYLLSGAVSNSKTVLSTGSSTGGQLGFSVAGGFDVNADGTPDVAVGEPFYKLNAIPRGRVRIISGATMGVLYTLTGVDDDQLGYSVGALKDADGDGRGDLIVGLPGGDIGGITNAGLVNVYSGATGLLLYQWNGYHTGEQMGYAVASGGELNNDPWTDMLSGAPSFDLNYTNGGRARLILGSAQVPAPYCTPKVNSAGCIPSIGFTGCASVSISNGFNLHGMNVLPGKPGIMMWSLAAGSMPFLGGTLCVSAPIRRTPPQLSVTTGVGACAGRYDFHFSHAYMASNGIGAGTAVHAQFWSRDSGFAAPNNVGLTNGLRFLTLP